MRSKPTLSNGSAHDLQRHRAAYESTTDEPVIVLPGEVTDVLPVDIVIAETTLLCPDRPGALDLSMLRGTSLRPLWLDSDEVVYSFLFEGATYRVESNEFLTTIASVQTQKRRRDAMKRLGLPTADWFDRTIDEDVRIMMDGMRSRPVM